MKVKSLKPCGEVIGLSERMGTVEQRGILWGHWLGSLNFEDERLIVDVFPGTIKNYREHIHNTYRSRDTEFREEDGRIRVYNQTTCVAGREIVRPMSDEDRYWFARQISTRHSLKLVDVRAITLDLFDALQRTGFCDNLECKVNPEVTEDYKAKVKKYLDASKEKDHSLLCGLGGIYRNQTLLYSIAHSPVRNYGTTNIWPIGDENIIIKPETVKTTPHLHNLLKAYKENIAPIQDLEIAKKLETSRRYDFLRLLTTALNPTTKLN